MRRATRTGDRVGRQAQYALFRHDGAGGSCFGHLSSPSGWIRNRPYRREPDRDAEAGSALIAKLDRFTRVLGLWVDCRRHAGRWAVPLDGHGLEDVFLSPLRRAVSAIPEGLPVAITVALAIATAADGAPARRSSGPCRRSKGLAPCTVIASDKTGTLTRNVLTLRRLVLPGTACSGRRRAEREDPNLGYSNRAPPGRWRWQTRRRSVRRSRRSRRPATLSMSRLAFARECGLEATLCAKSSRARSDVPVRGGA